MYKAKNVDTDKALEALNYALKIQRETVEIEKCSNYEKTEKGGADNG